MIQSIILSNHPELGQEYDLKKINEKTIVKQALICVIQSLLKGQEIDQDNR